MKKFTTKEITLYAILMALTTVATMVINIPIPATKGYLNLGDSVVIFSALMIGAKAGFLVGGIGSALADLILGYPHYAIITFVVKGLEGYICAKIFKKTGYTKPYLAAGISGLFMATGYLTAEVFMYGPGAAIASYLPNIAQGLAGAFAATLLYPVLNKGLKTLDIGRN